MYLANVSEFSSYSKAIHETVKIHHKKPKKTQMPLAPGEVKQKVSLRKKKSPQPIHMIILSYPFISTWKV